MNTHLNRLVRISAATPIAAALVALSVIACGNAVHAATQVTSFLTSPLDYTTSDYPGDYANNYNYYSPFQESGGGQVITFATDSNVDGENDTDFCYIENTADVGLDPLPQEFSYFGTPQTNSDGTVGINLLTTYDDAPAPYSTYNGPNGPLTISFSTGVSEFGLYAQNQNGQENEDISYSLFDGTTSLGSFTAPSTADNAYFVSGETSGLQDITSVVINSNTEGFFITPVTFNDISAAPEPSQIGMLALISLGLGGLILRARRKRSVQVEQS